jgi:hypothetical protein
VRWRRAKRAALDVVKNMLTGEACDRLLRVGWTAKPETSMHRSTRVVVLRAHEPKSVGVSQPDAKAAVSSLLTWFYACRQLSASSSVLIALALTLGAIELVRRELALHRRSVASRWRVDAAAAGALFTAVAAVGAWLSLTTDRAPTEELVGILAWLGVMAFLLVADERVR